MSSRITILACGQVERDGVILNEVQVQILDRVTNKEYNVDCYLISNQQLGDYYNIEVYSVEKGKLVDTCRMDSTGGIFMDDDFSCDEIDDELGFEITQLFTTYFIVPF